MLLLLDLYLSSNATRLSLFKIQLIFSQKRKAACTKPWLFHRDKGVSEPEKILNGLFRPPCFHSEWSLGWVPAPLCIWTCFQCTSSATALQANVVACNWHSVVSCMTLATRDCSLRADDAQVTEVICCTFQGLPPSLDKRLCFNVVWIDANATEAETAEISTCVYDAEQSQVKLWM